MKVGVKISFWIPERSSGQGSVMSTRRNGARWLSTVFGQAGAISASKRAHHGQPGLSSMMSSAAATGYIASQRAAASVSTRCIGSPCIMIAYIALTAYIGQRNDGPSGGLGELQHA